ncbi:hypothetical protein, partial [Ruminococcus sp.]|uniref:hypothetical protein n=1 Tax=Ruminococcus sp. TaxID=41978 RepID=UPI003F81EC13
YLWALPTPTTFEKVDQTFDFGTESLGFALLCCPTETKTIIQKTILLIQTPDFQNNLRCY